MRKTLESNKILMNKLNHIEEQVLENSEGIQELRFEFKKVIQEDEVSGRKICFMTK